MKNPLTTIIDQIIIARTEYFLLTGKLNSVIQLSDVFMKLYNDETAVITGKYFHFDDQLGAEISIKKNEIEWEIRCRPYRDNTNDPQVEELFFKLLLSK